MYTYIYVCQLNVYIYILQAISSTAVCTILPEKPHLQVISLRKSLKAPGSCSLWRSCCRSRHYYSAMTLLQRHWHFPAPGWTKLYSFAQPREPHLMLQSRRSPGESQHAWADSWTSSIVSQPLSQRQMLEASSHNMIHGMCVKTLLSI